MVQVYQIGALWIGGALSFLEQLCLHSFVDAGHHVKLFSYGPVENVPDEIEFADATEVLPMDRAIRHTRTGSPAPQADRFRYHLLAQNRDIIWADTDAYCVKPFTTGSGHFYGWESPHHVNNGVLGLPNDSETLQNLVEFTSDEFAIPEWLTAAEQDAMRAAKDAGQPIGVGDQQWGAWGPRALTHFLAKTGEIRHALPREALYPIGFKDRALLVRSAAGAERFITNDTRSIHFYGRRIRHRIQLEGGEPPADSLIGRLLQKHGIVASEAPLPELPAAPQPLAPTSRAGRGRINITDIADALGSDRGSRRHEFTNLYQMLFLPLREKPLKILLVGLDEGIGVTAPELWQQNADNTLELFLKYFPNSEFLALDRHPDFESPPDRVRYRNCSFEDTEEIARVVDFAPDIVLDDATHASHHQQNCIRAIFPKLANGGLYIVEDLRTQPAPLEKQGLVKTASLFTNYLNTGVFDHPDEEANAEFNGIRADISGCFVFQAKFQKTRRDQVLVLHKR